MEITLDVFTVYGDTIRTNHNNPRPFGEAWGRFLNETRPVEGAVYAVYSNYHSDFAADFDYTVAQKINSGKPAVIIPAGRYFVWDVGTTDPAAVNEAWLKIWLSAIKRTYRTDFVAYVPGETIKIYLSI